MHNLNQAGFTTCISAEVHNKKFNMYSGAGNVF